MARTRGRFQKIGHILKGATLSFFKDNCYTKASALTFYSIQAIVPFLAFVLGIAKGFGLDTFLESLITKGFHEQKEVLSYAIEIANAMLQNIKGGVIAGFGVIFLIYTTVNLLQYIETAFNEIWKIRSNRSYFQKYSDYIAALVICPIIVAVSTSLTFYVRSQILHLEENPDFEKISHIILPFFKVIPWVLSWLGFFFLYYLIPDSTSKLWTKVVGAIFAGSAFQLWQLLYITLQVKVFSYNAVYGTFAIIPLFLIWLQFSWLIALAGAELAAHLEIDIFPRSKHAKQVSNRQLGLLIVYLCFQAFYKGEKPLSDAEISRELKIPLDVTQKMVDLLVDGQILAEVKRTDHQLGYNPLYDGRCFTLKQVLDLIDNQNNFGVSLDSTDALKIVSDRLHQIDDLIRNSKANVSISSLF